VAALAREVVPDLPLHASTQMTIHNREGVLRAAGEGFSRGGSGAGNSPFQKSKI
jgi:putative protease